MPQQGIITERDAAQREIINALHRPHREAFDRIFQSQIPLEICSITHAKNQDVTDLLQKICSKERVVIIASYGLAVKGADELQQVLPATILSEADSLPESMRFFGVQDSIYVLRLEREAFERLGKDAAIGEALQQHSVTPSRMPPELVELAQHTRDGNINSIVTLEVIPFVLNKLIPVLNPEGVTIRSPFESREVAIDVDGNKLAWALINRVRTLALAIDTEVVPSLAVEARLKADRERSNGYSEEDITALAVHHFDISVRNFEKRLLNDELPQTTAMLNGYAMGDNERGILTTRLLQIAWLEGKIQKGRSLHQNDSTLIKLLPETFTSVSATCRLLDAAIEERFDALTAQGDTEILSIGFVKHPAEVIERSKGKALPRKHPYYQLIGDLAERLRKGDRSAVGGSMYPVVKTPESVVQALAGGEGIAVMYQGSHENGIRYVRDHFGDFPGALVKTECTEIQLRGPYGRFSQSALLLKNGTFVLLMSHQSSKRLQNEAATLLLYKNEKGQRVSPDQIHYIEEVEPEAARTDFARHFDNFILNTHQDALVNPPFQDPSIKADALRTQALILLHPKQLKTIFGDSVDLREYRSERLGLMHVAYVQAPDREIVRLIVPTVGGSGLYGDTAGFFTGAFFNCPHIKKDQFVYHVLFYATAGGFAGTANHQAFKSHGILGLPDQKPGGIIMPTGAIVDMEGTYPMHTLPLDMLLQSGQVSPYARHYSVPYPAFETQQWLDALIESNMVSGIDVESAHIQRAIQRYTERHGQPITFTPIYDHSDDPRNARFNPTEAWAFSAALVSHAKRDPKGAPIIRELLHLSWAVKH